MIYSSPLAFSSLGDEKLRQVANSYLPFSTGIEIECSSLVNFPEWEKSRIEGLISEVHDSTEKRFRIPAGIEGMICLFKISEWLKENCGLNEKSGIHYHIDMGREFYRTHPNYDEINTEWMLASLDKWKYDGEFNSRGVTSVKRSWVTFRLDKSSMEFRLGEMTFDYELLIKRIINCQNIVRRFKSLCKLNNQLTKPRTIRIHGFNHHGLSSSMLGFG